jgi:glycine/D-amino acid oxidase-like deaminating enzyme
MNASPSSAASSFWAASASSPAKTYPQIEGSLDTDILVVGGGFSGLSAALHLAEAGTDVCLVEAHDIAHGASGRNGGQANPGVKLSETDLVRRFGKVGSGLFRLGEEAVDFLAALIARRNLHCHFIRPGLVRLAHSMAAMKAVEESCAALNARGIAARLLMARDVKEVVGTDRYFGGMIDPRGGNLHPLDLARELARDATESGARIFVRSPARSLRREGGRWVVECGGGTVRAREVVVTTNAYTDGLVAGLAQSILPVNSFQIATEPIGAALDREILSQLQAVYDSRRLVLYFRKTHDGRIMLGGRASFSSADHDHARAADYDVLIDVLRGIFPQLKDVRAAYRWTGLVCITPDFLPHYHAPQPGLHVALGFNGRGVAMANRTGAWLARKLLGQPDSGEIPPTDIHPIPMHAWRAPALHAAMQWSRVMDFVGR